MSSQLCCGSHRHDYSSTGANIRHQGYQSKDTRRVLRDFNADDSECLASAATATSKDTETSHNITSDRPRRRRLVKKSTSSEDPVDKTSSSKNLGLRVKRALSRDSFQFGPTNRRSTPILPFLRSGDKVSTPKIEDAIGLYPLDSMHPGNERYDSDAQIISDSQVGLVTASATPKDSQRTNPANNHHTTISEVADDYTGLTADGNTQISLVLWQMKTPVNI